MGHRSAGSTRAVRWGVSVVFWLGWLLALADNLAGIGRIVSTTPLDRARVTVVAASLVLVVPAWLWAVRSRSSVRAVVVLGLVVATLFTASNTGLSVFPLLAVVLVLLTLRAGPRAGMVAVAVMTAWVVLVIALYYRGRLVEIIGEGATVALVLSVIMMFATLLRQVERSEQRATEANAQLLRANEELRAANDSLRAASLVERDLVLAQERARTSRELHDGLGHRLTLVGMSLDYARRVRADDADAAWAEIEHAAATNRETLDLMRRWVRALHPPAHLPSVSGAAAFDAIAESFRGTGLAVEVRPEGMAEPPPLPKNVSLLLHRVVQEGLTNVLRHADATHVTIVVRQEPDLVELTVVDDGTGEDETDEGFGRRNLRERAEALGGTVTGRLRPGGGFELVARLPLAGAPEAVAR